MLKYYSAIMTVLLCFQEKKKHFWHSDYQSTHIPLVKQIHSWIDVAIISDEYYDQNITFFNS